MSVDTDLTISGKVAQFGSSMTKQVSEKLLGEFTACLEDRRVVPVVAGVVIVAVVIYFLVR